jgi:hypothetical protein
MNLNEKKEDKLPLVDPQLVLLPVLLMKLGLLRVLWSLCMKIEVVLPT